MRLPQSLWAAAAVEQEARREREPSESDLVDAITGVKGFVPTQALYSILGVGGPDNTSRRLQRHSSMISRVMLAHGWQAARRGTKAVRGYENDPAGPWLDVDGAGSILGATLVPSKHPALAAPSNSAGTP